VYTCAWFNVSPSLDTLYVILQIHVVTVKEKYKYQSMVSEDGQELSYRKQIARQLRIQFVEGISVTLKSTLRVTQGHWKRNHWTDHTRLTVRRVIRR